MNVSSQTDEQGFAASRGCLLYDVENVGGGTERAQRIHKLLSESGIGLKRVIIAGPRHQVDAVANSFQDCEFLDKYPCPSGRQVADIELATHAGICLVHALTLGSYDALLIATGDLALLRCGRPWIESGLPVCILSKTADSKRLPPEFRQLLYEVPPRAAFVASAPAFDPETYGYFFDGAPQNVDGLLVMNLPQPRDPVPHLIPLPLTAQETSIGSKPGECDVPLQYWEEVKNGGLYSPHAFFGCSSSGWYIRSSHGLRRGKRITRVNDRVLSARDGNISIRAGDRITLGGVDFQFQTCVESAFSAHPPNSEGPHDQLIAIERWFHHAVADVLKNCSADWWETKVPSEVRHDCMSRISARNSTEHPYRYILLREIQAVIIVCWSDFLRTAINRNWGSKTQLRRTFSDLIEIRNKLMHPTRNPPTEMELALLTRLSHQLF